MGGLFQKGEREPHRALPPMELKQTSTRTEEGSYMQTATTRIDVATNDLLMSPNREPVEISK